MADLPPCQPSTPVTECCLTTIPNVSEWQIVCPTVAVALPTAAVVPVLSPAGLLVMAGLLGALAVKMARGAR